MLGGVKKWEFRYVHLKVNIFPYAENTTTFTCQAAIAFDFPRFSYSFICEELIIHNWVIYGTHAQFVYLNPERHSREKNKVEMTVE